MKLKLLALILLAGSFCNAQPVFNWAKSFGDANDDQGKSIALDATGNVYVAGVFTGTADFDPGPAAHTLTANGSSQDIFIAKYNASGDYLWAVNIGNSNDEMVNKIAVDASGNLYATGYFYGTVDFDPGATAQNLTCIGYVEAFVLKLDALGNYVWAKQIGGAGSGGEVGQSVAVDANGNILIAGCYDGTPDLDPGINSQIMPFAGSQDAFICKWDASGNYIWGRSVNGPSIENPWSIATDATGNVYTAGHFIGSAVDFDPGAGIESISPVGSADIFILKLDINGNFVWVKQMGGAGATSVNRGIGVDASGNVIITGGFIGTTDFDPGAGVTNFTSTGTDIYAAKLTAAGGLVWAKQISGSSDELAQSLALDAAGNVYMAGTYGGTPDFDPDATATYTLANAGAYDIFVSKLNSTGDFVWARSMGGVNVDMGLDIAVNGADNIFTTGYFRETADFDPDAGTQNLTAAGAISGSDVFIARFIPSTSLPLTLLQFQAENNGNDVQLNWQTSQEENTTSFAVERSADGKTFTTIGTVKAVNNASFKNNYALTDAQPLNGTAYYRLKMIDIDGRFTYSQMVSVRRNDNNATLQLAPNPASNVLYVQAKGSEPVTVQITDMHSRLLQQQSRILNGNTSFSVNIGQLSPGIYYLTVKGKQLNLVQSFIKQ